MPRMSQITRRTIVAGTGILLAGNIAASSAPNNTFESSAPPQLTAGDVITRIKKNIGIPWREKTVDNLLTATPETPIHGIATTMMATQDVIERAVSQGANMIITHETPFYIHQDRIDDTQSPGGISLTNDPVLNHKLDYCRKHSVAIFHFHDHWHAQHPDGIAQGMVNQLGWQKNVTGFEKLGSAADPKKLTFPGIPLAAFASQIAQTLNARTIRVVGDPNLSVRNVQTSWGYIGRETGIPLLANPETEVLICGETREWELVEYVQDSIQMGHKKALILVGHVLSEQGGMILCRDWLKSFIAELPIQFVPATEPFWNPAPPPAA